MFRRSMLFSLAVLSVVSHIPKAHSQEVSFIPAKLADRIHKEAAKAQVGGSLTVLSTELAEGLGIAVKYRMESEPSYVNGFYTRLDKYSFDMNVNPGEMINDLDLPMTFEIKKGAELVFARQFKSQKESIVATPYTPMRIPLSAERALKYLNVGDFVGLEANLAFVVSVGDSSLLNSLTANISTHAYISGNFMVHLFRLPDNKMRVKLISLNKRGVGLNAGMDYARDLNIVGFNYLERRIEKIIDLSPLALGVDRSKNAVFMLDYVFDLKNPEVAKAYDQMMLKKIQFQEFKNANPFQSAETMSSKVLTDLSAVENIVKADSQIPTQQKRIHRLFKGLNQSFSTNANFKIGMNLLKFENGGGWASSKVTSYDKANQPQRFLLESLTTKSKAKGLFGIWATEDHKVSSLLFKANEDFTPAKFATMSFDRVHKETELDRGDLEDIQKEVAGLIPAYEYMKIPWYLYNFNNGDYINSAYRIKIFFHPDALYSLPMLGEQGLKDAFEAFVTKVGLPNVAVANKDEDRRNTGPYRFEQDYFAIAEHLNVVINPNVESQKRLEAFKALRDIPLWQARGEGFLISLMPTAKMEDLISFEFNLSSKNGPVISHKFGKFDQEPIYDAVTYTQNLINNQGFDLRLWTDENGEYTVKSK